MNSSIYIRKFLIILFALLPFLLSFQVIRKTKVSFTSEDGVKITADHYYSRKSNSYIILFHQEGASRGEFETIAERFLKMNFNCLAVDLRSGDKYNFTINETASHARELGLSTSLFESIKDVRAAIEYVKRISGKPVILLGSSFSASLSLITAKDDPNIQAVIAFSPGEFFLPVKELKSELKAYPKPVFAGFSEEEAVYVENMFSLSHDDSIRLFSPSYKSGKRTAEALLSSNESSDEYWLALIIFLRSLQK